MFVAFGDDDGVGVDDVELDGFVVSSLLALLSLQRMI